MQKLERWRGLSMLEKERSASSGGWSERGRGVRCSDSTLQSMGRALNREVTYNLSFKKMTDCLFSTVWKGTGGKELVHHLDQR